MEYKVYEDAIVLRLDPGDPIVKSIVEVAQKEDIRTASILGFGATDDVEIGIMDLRTKKYAKKHFQEPLEITTLVGNLTRKDGEVYLHSHINLGDVEGHLHGGHFHEGIISVTAEIFIRPVAANIEREYDEQIGVNKMAF